MAGLEVGNGGTNRGAHADRVVDDRNPFTAEPGPEREWYPVVDREQPGSLTNDPLREDELHPELQGHQLGEERPATERAAHGVDPMAGNAPGELGDVWPQHCWSRKQLIKLQPAVGVMT